MIRLIEKTISFGVRTRFSVILFFCAGSFAFAKDVTISWEPLLHAREYEILIQQKGSDVLKQRIHSVKTEWKGELPYGFYVYQLRAIDRTERPGEWTEIHALTVLPPPPKPMQPSSRATLSLLHPKDEVVLEWNSVKGADRYFVRVTRGDDVFFAGSVTGTKKPLNGLKAGEYSWEVQSVVVADDKSPDVLHGKEWKTNSDLKRSFKVRYRTLLPPTLVFPENPALLTQRDVHLQWKKVNEAEAYEVRLIREDEPSDSRAPSEARDDLGAVYVTQNTGIDVHLQELGRYRWKVRALARIDQNQKPGVVSNASAGSFLLDPYSTPDRRASLAFSYFASPYEYSIASPAGSGALAQSSVSVASTFQLSGGLSLSSNWILQTVVEESLWKMGGGTAFSKFGFLLDAGYRVSMGEGDRAWVFTPSLGVEDRDNRQLIPIGNATADPNSPPIHALGPDISFDLRKFLGAKSAVGATVSYFLPVRVFVPRYETFASFSGPPSPEVSYQNWGAGVYALFWLSPQWGVSLNAGIRNDEISFHQNAQLFQVQMDELRIGASLIFGWGG